MQEKIMELIKEFEVRLQTLKEEYKECELEKGEIYWSILEAGNLVGRKWLDTEYDKKCYKIGNAFQTKAEAEFEVERLKVLRELEKMGRPYAYDLYDLCICLCANDKVGCRIETDAISMYGKYYFSSEEEAKEAVEEIGEDRIKKYLFGVEE